MRSSTSLLSFILSASVLSSIAFVAESQTFVSKVNTANAGELSFEENLGQFPGTDISFVMRGNNFNIHFLKNSIRFIWTRPSSKNLAVVSEATGKVERDFTFESFTDELKHGRFETVNEITTLSWKGANLKPEIVAEQPIKSYNNYYNANTPNGVTRVSSFKAITYKNIYPNIDLVFSVDGPDLKWRYAMRDGADPKDIKVSLNGNAILNKDGDLLVSNALGYITLPGLSIANSAHSKSQSVPDGQVISAALVLSPLITNADNLEIKWGTYFGGENNEVGLSTHVRDDGTIYLAGYTASTTSIAVGGHQTSYGGDYDGFISKFDSEGDLEWSTYYGGSGYDYVNGITTNSLGEVIAIGETGSSSAITYGGSQSVFGGGSADAFIVKFAGDGTRIWSTYFGGAGSDHGFSVKCINDGILISGYTNSEDAIASNGHQNVIAGGSDIFLAKFEYDGSRVWSTYFGGPSDDTSQFGAIATDASNNILLTGFTYSASGIAHNGHQTVFGGDRDAVLAKFDGNGSLVWSTYYGGSGYDYAEGVIVDEGGNSYIVGLAGSTNNISFNGHQNSHAGGAAYDGFIVKFNSNGVRQWGSYLGGTNNDELLGICNFGTDHLLVAGYSSSTTGIALKGFQNDFGGGDNDAIVAEFSLDGELIWGSYYGGTQQEIAVNVVGDGTGSFYLCGYTASTSDIAVNGFQNSHGGGTYDSYVSKFGSIQLAVPTILDFNPKKGLVGTLVTINGSNFSAIATENYVYFGAAKADVISASSSELRVHVPVGATFEPITVTVAGLQVSTFVPFIVTFEGSGPIDPNSFSAATYFPVGDNPVAVTIVDLNEDSKSEIISANAHSNTLSVLKNLSDASTLTFAPKADIQAGTLPRNVIHADIDCDGKQDLIAPNQSSNSVSISRNTTNGEITFELKIDLALPSCGFGASVADLNADGKPELIVTSYCANSVSVFENISSPGQFDQSSFSSPVTFTTPLHPADLFVTNLTNDKKPELIVVNNDANSISIFKNIGTGQINAGLFAAPIELATGDTPIGLAVGDLDNDSLYDLICANLNGGSLSFFRNVSAENVSFENKFDITTGSAPHVVSISDLNGDSHLDVLVTNANSGTISILENTGLASSLSPSTFKAKIDIAVGSTTGLALADMDADHKPEIILTEEGNDRVSVLRNLIDNLSIASFTPVAGPIGTELVISGTGFSDTSEDNVVKINGIESEVIESTSTSITAIVPAGASTGKVSVGVSSRMAISADDFTVIFPPIITSMSPYGALVGSTVLIYGSNFSATGSDNTIDFNGVTAVATQASSTELLVTVPPGSTSGMVSVTTNGLTASSEENFIVWNLTDQGVPTNGLVAYYPFNGNATDESGNGHNGIIHGAKLTPNRFGAVNRALAFGGTDFVSIHDHDDLDITNDLTISAWFYSEGPPTFRTFHTIASKVDRSSGISTPYDFGINYQYTIPSDYKKPMFVVARDGTAQYVQAKRDITNNNWNHAVVIVQNDIASIYINDFLFLQETVDNTKRVQNAAELLIGSGNRPDAPAEFMVGKLDEIAIYNRALDRNEVTQLFTAGKLIQKITFGELPTKVYGDIPFTLTSNSTSALPITFISSDQSIATISDNIVTIHKAGTVKITATQPGNVDYVAASPVERTLIVNKAVLTVVADNKERTFGQPNPIFTVTYTGFKNGDDQFNLETQPTIQCDAHLRSLPGEYDISPTLAEDINYSFVYNTGKLLVNKLSQTISFDLPTVVYLNQSPFQMDATSSYHLPIIFTVTEGVAQVNGNSLIFTETGLLSIAATQMGNDTVQATAAVDNVIVKGDLVLSGLITKPGLIPLTRGIAKLFFSDGGLAINADVINGNFQMSPVQNGTYILQVVPTGSGDNEVYPTYFVASHFHKDATLIQFKGDTLLTMELLPKGKVGQEPDGTGAIHGRIVSGKGASGGRWRTGRIKEGEGIANIPVYLLPENDVTIVSTALTDSEGYFQINKISLGRYRFALDIVGASLDKTSATFTLDEQEDLEVTAVVDQQTGTTNISFNLVTGLESQSGFQIKVYPNPAKIHLSVEISDKVTSLKTLTLTSVNGSKIAEQEIEINKFRYEFDLLDFDAGFYVLRLIGDNRTIFKKVIVIK